MNALSWKWEKNNFGIFLLLFKQTEESFWQEAYV